MNASHRRQFSTALMLALWFTSEYLYGAASILIWPITPVIRQHERASALWLENQGTTPVPLQIRVVSWTEEDFADRYDIQPAGVIASPPVVTIAPGARQLVRLTKIEEASHGRETAYRVLIDELPQFDAASTAVSTSEATLGVKVRMRYSLPLFIYGQGLRPPGDEAAARGAGVPAKPDVTWRIERERGRRFLYVRNEGTAHARLSQVGLIAGDGRFDVARGLLGYVLAGATMRWELPSDAPEEGTTLEASIANRQGVTRLRPF